MLVLCVICTCFLNVGRTSAYVSDISNTVVNTFSGEDITEPTSEQTTQAETQEPETVTTYVDTSPVSPATGKSESAALAVAVAAFFVCSGFLAIKCTGKNKKAK